MAIEKIDEDIVLTDADSVLWYACTHPDCGGVIGARTTFHVPERDWGADADGNRGVTIPGGFDSVTVDTECSLSHAISEASQKLIAVEANAYLARWLEG